MQQIELDNKYSTYNEKLDSGLRTEKTLSKILKKHNYTDKTKRKYLNMKVKYYKLFMDRLLQENFCAGEIQDIFNYCFKDWYFKNIPSNSKRKRTLVIDDFINSYEFEKFQMTENTVTGISKQDSIRVLGFYDPVNLNAKSFNVEDIY